MNCRQCGYQLNEEEIRKATVGEKPYDMGITPSEWDVDPDEVEWYCGNCARSNDPDVPEEWEVYYLG